MLSVMAMQVNRPRQVADRFRESQCLRTRNSLVPHRKMDVLQSELVSSIDIRPGSVHRNDRLDPQLLEGSKTFIPLRTATAQQRAVDLINVMQPLFLDLHGRFRRPHGITPPRCHTIDNAVLLLAARGDLQQSQRQENPKTTHLHHPLRFPRKHQRNRVSRNGPRPAAPDTNRTSRIPHKSPDRDPRHRNRWNTLSAHFFSIVSKLKETFVTPMTRASRFPNQYFAVSA